MLKESTNSESKWLAQGVNSLVSFTIFYFWYINSSNMYTVIASNLANFSMSKIFKSQITLFVIFP